MEENISQDKKSEEKNKMFKKCTSCLVFVKKKSIKSDVLPQISSALFRTKSIQKDKKAQTILN